MNRKAVVLVIVTFLAILFLSTVGGVFTGFATYMGGETNLKDYPFPFIKNSYNKLLIVTPNNPTSTEFLAANKIAQSLKTYSKQPLLPKIVTDEWFKARDYDLESYNLILIGKRTNNKIISKFLAQNPKILLADNSDDGSIIIFNNKRLVKSATMIVSGNVEKAADVLANFKNYPLKGNSISVLGTKSYTLNYKS